MTTTRVHVVDASPYIFRAFFSIPSKMKNPEGAPINAVFGFNQFLHRLITLEAVTHIALAFDRSLTTSFRNEIYPDYKKQRELPPQELEDQLSWCERLGAALGATTFVHETYEADDLIGTLCRQLEGSNAEIVIVTSDKDLAQLVDERVTVFDFAREERYGPEEVMDKFGVRPDQLTDFIGLMGDSVDNIPGVAGIGKKTAAALLTELPSLEAIYRDLSAVAELKIRGARSLAKKLAEQREMAFLSKELARIAVEAPLQADLESLRLREPDSERLARLREELGFDPLKRAGSRG